MLTIDPFEVRFTQDSIGSRFRSGGTVDELAENLRNGTVLPPMVPPIRAFEKDGKLYSLDNRRLEAFRRAGVEIPYRMAMPEEIETESWKFRTENDGISVRVRK